MKKLEGEIWYPYTYDLGQYVIDFEGVFPKLLEYNFFLAGFNSVEEKTYFKENEKLFVSQFYSSEVAPEQRFAIETVPKSTLKKTAVEFLGLYRLSEINHFGDKYREYFQYLRFVLFPTFLKIEPQIKERFLLLIPIITISSTGILTVTFRLKFRNISFKQLLRLENLYEENIRSVALPQEVMLLHQHLAALYHGLDVKTEVYQDLINVIKPFNLPEDIKMSCGTAENMFISQIADNYRYLIVEKLFFKRKLKESDFENMHRTTYWQCRPSVFVHKFEGQGRKANDIFSKKKESLLKLFFRSDTRARDEHLHSLKNLRAFDDYLLFANVGLTLKIYSKSTSDSLERKYEGNRLQNERLYLNLATQVIMDYIHTLFMNLKVRESLAFNKPPGSIKNLIQNMEDKACLNYLLETDVVHSGELQDLIQHVKNEMGFNVLEEKIRQSFDLHRLRLESVRNDTIFWFGLFVTVLLGLGNLSVIADTIFTPIFQLTKWPILIDHRLLFTGFIVLLLIPVAFFAVRKLMLKSL